MRKVAYTIGLLLLAGSVFAFLKGSLLLISGKIAFGIYFWIAGILALAGFVTSSLAKNQTCRNCLHRFDAAAPLCPHCGGVAV
jgi:hypothetical protein